MWGSLNDNYMGRQLCAAIYDAELVPLNDSEPTFLSYFGCLFSNLDLAFYSPGLIPIASVSVGSNS